MSGLKPTLRLDWCSHEAAKYAVEHWHYSGSLPAGKNVRIGVWEDETFIGCVIFARGSNKHIGMPYGLNQDMCVELVRVAFQRHRAPVSRILSIACRMASRQSPGLRLIVSFADTGQGHVGTIYQAAGWTFVGVGSDDVRSRPYRARDGSIQHWRTVAARLHWYGLPSTIEGAVAMGYVPLSKKPKYRYIYPLDAAMRAQIAPLAKPYPKRLCAGSIDGDAPASHVGEGGSVPTSALYGQEVPIGKT